MTDDHPTAGKPPTLHQLVERQIEQGEKTVRSVDGLRASIDRRTLATVVLVLLLCGVAVDNRLQINQLKQTLCPIVTASITRPGETGPTTPHGRDVERSATNLARKLGCEVLPR